MELLCRSLLTSFASLPLTREWSSSDEAPRLANAFEIQRELVRQYPPAARRWAPRGA